MAVMGHASCSRLHRLHPLSMVLQRSLAAIRGVLSFWAEELQQ